MASPSSAGLLTPSADALWRWGHTGLVAALGLGLVTTLAVAWAAPESLVFVVGILVALPTLVGLFRSPLLNLAVVLAGHVLLITTTAGVQPSEVLYGLYYLGYLGYWYGTHLIARTPLIETTLDRAAALLLVFGLGGGIALGFALGASLPNVRGEALAFGMLLFYFPVKEACARYRYGPAVVMGALAWHGAFVVLRNAFRFQEALESATHLVEIAGARAALNETQVLVGALGGLIFLLLARSWPTRTLAFAGFVFFAVGLLMTKARGFWVDFLFGTLVLLMLVDTRDRWRLAFLLTAGVASVGAAFLLFFGDTFRLLLAGFSDRFTSLGSAATQDLSLVNRFNEAAAALEHTRTNPILGHGLGSTSPFFNWIYKFTVDKPFIHNGYVALLFKMGIPGLLLLLFFWANAAWLGVRVSRWASVPAVHRALALTGAVALIAIIPSVATSSPFYIDDSMLSFTLLTALCAGLHSRYRPPLLTPASPAPVQGVPL